MRSFLGKGSALSDSFILIFVHHYVGYFVKIVVQKKTYTSIAMPTKARVLITTTHCVPTVLLKQQLLIF